jgi:hypothetical protein
MRRMLRHKPSPALVISVIALIIAMGGTGYAAISLPKNSVGTKQLKKNAVKSSKVKNGSLLSKDFKSGQLPAGPQGPAGPRGPAGTQGPRGPAGKNGTNAATNVVARDSAGITVADGDDDFDSVDCHAGEKATGGGVFITDGSNIINTDATVNESDATLDSNGDPTGWEGGIHNASGGPVTLVVEAICASP